MRGIIKTTNADQFLNHENISLNEQQQTTFQLIPWESSNTILANKWTDGSSGKWTSQLMFYVSRKRIKSFSGGSLVSISLSKTDFKYVAKILILNSLTFN